MSNDPFSEEESRLSSLEVTLDATDWEDPDQAKAAADQGASDLRWLLKRYRRMLKMSDRLELQLKSTLDKEAEQRAALEKANRTIQETQDELVQSAKLAALGGMVAGIAHEINTPLGIIRTAASSLAADTKRLKGLAEQGQARKSDVFGYFDSALEAVELMDGNGDRAARLIQSFKEVAVDQSSEARREFALAEYVDEVVDTLRPELKKTPHTIRNEVDPTLVVDGLPGAMSQIVTNLIMNSIKHAYGPGQVGTLTFTGGVVGENLANLTYSDDGNGVPEELQSTKFDPFVTTKRGQGGSGLGLHILHNLIVGKLGGKVVYRDTPGGGATFDMTFLIVRNDVEGA